ncbi:MAG: hypothetical protein ACOYNZ_11100 [Rhodoferax sp.]
MNSASTPVRPAQTALTAITLWPVAVLAQNLVAAQPTTRVLALGMALQPGAPINDCVHELVRAADLSQGDPLALKLVATALGALQPGRAADPVQASLAAMLAPAHQLPVRIAAAHAMYRLRCLPAEAMDSICQLLLDADNGARKVALHAFSPFARSAQGAIAACMARTAPAQWTLEALLALARSAGDDGAAQRSVEAFVMRSLSGTALVPTGIAAYAALASLNPHGAALAALVKVAADARTVQESMAALDALGELGETARPAARHVAEMLVATEDPVREELLCRTLVKLRPAKRELPLDRVLQRLRDAPDRAAAAHCMLLCLYPKEFARAGAVLNQRFAVAADALRRVLSQTHKTLTGFELGGDVAAAGS